MATLTFVVPDDKVTLVAKAFGYANGGETKVLFIKRMLTDIVKGKVKMYERQQAEDNFSGTEIDIS